MKLTTTGILMIEASSRGRLQGFEAILGAMQHETEALKPRREIRLVGFCVSVLSCRVEMKRKTPKSARVIEQQAAPRLSVAIWSGGRQHGACVSGR